MVWRVNVKRDYGMDHVVETDSRYSTEAYRMIQEAAFAACRDKGEHCRISITARNGEGLTLMLSDMGWSRDGLRTFEEIAFKAVEMSHREGIL